ncbi:Zinc uptake regulation protein [Rhodovastum atsumiense]|uniref:Ferric uptake regulation protein n=1 Tax=Rhodovastum atsumiense TaxID=504468 RepID=A0A5M6IUW9_9PROT|nr:Fur family transcriptional regulator [Rhodovastum atsumiense]KAA5612021.1 transcriptional repressor [Rhodovastum atsumiense]CAH2604118.1 Zinc uptake regulation protein [Rhodovastum atsumiense]
MVQEGNPGAFSARTTALLDRAARLCEERGAKLTDLRRDVLGLILETEAPTGAYELLDRLRARRGGGAPPTVYRALDFLVEQGLVHRLERLSAFVGCIDVCEAPHAHHEAVQFLICRGCGRVTEIEDHGLAEALAAAARRVGFTVTGATIEAEGLCANCRS